MIDLSQKNILITGGHGFLGGNLVKNLIERRKVPRESIFLPSQNELDLRNFENCKKAVDGKQVVFHLAANVGSIEYNRQNPGAMFYDNMVMGANLMEASRLAGVEKFIVVGTVCCYPQDVPIPTPETALFKGYPEPITAPYGFAKLMLLVQGKAYQEQYGFRSVFLIPTNLYGPGDHFDSEKAHAAAALIKRFVDAVDNNTSAVEVWGTGKAHREFIYVDDAVEALALAAEKYEKSDPINIGTGKETSIKEIAELIAKLTGFQGEIHWDTSKPDGRLRRNLDVARAKEEFGFQASTPLEEGLAKTIAWYRNQKKVV